MVIQPEEVRILGDWAYAHGSYAFEMAPKEGGGTRRWSGKFLDILEKQVDGSWKIAIDCHNYDAPSQREGFRAK
jgi:ketosteroid isomerase-like protein